MQEDIHSSCIAAACSCISAAAFLNINTARSRFHASQYRLENARPASCSTTWQALDHALLWSAVARAGPVTRLPCGLLELACKWRFPFSEFPRSLIFQTRAPFFIELPALGLQPPGGHDTTRVWRGTYTQTLRNSIKTYS